VRECVLHKEQRVQGKPGARCARSLACQSDKAHEHSHHRFSENIRPLRMARVHALPVGKSVFVQINPGFARCAAADSATNRPHILLSREKPGVSLFTPGPEPAERWMLFWERAAAPLARSVPAAGAWPACSAQAGFQQELRWPPPALRIFVARERSLTA
jgi:hypothetical protein